MRIGSLFSGIGGLELGLERALGWSVAWQVEQNDFGRLVLAKHWPKAKRFDDVRTVGSANLDPVSLICGGFPCQDVSIAGLGAGIHEGTRSGLWIEFARIVDELAPEWVVVENVASGAGRWLSRVRHDLRSLGYGTSAYALSAADVGAPHVRARIFVLGHADSGASQQGQVVSPRGERLRQPEDERLPRDVADGDGERIRRANEPGRAAAPVAVDDREALAHGDGDGRERVAALGLPRAGQQHDTDRRHAWPPRRGDWSGWEDYAGPKPGICRSADGLSRRVDKHRLKALGNAVVPQCAEAIGRIIAEAVTATEAAT